MIVFGKKKTRNYFPYLLPLISAFQIMHVDHECYIKVILFKSCAICCQFSVIFVYCKKCTKWLSLWIRNIVKIRYIRLIWPIRIKNLYILNNRIGLWFDFLTITANWTRWRRIQASSSLLLESARWSIRSGKELFFWIVG